VLREWSLSMRRSSLRPDPTRRFAESLKIARPQIEAGFMPAGDLNAIKRSPREFPFASTRNALKAQCDFLVRKWQFIVIFDPI
jgi:hypothetical protein